MDDPVGKSPKGQLKPVPCCCMIWAHTGRPGDETVEKEIRELALQQEDVLGVDLIHTRVFGNRIYVDIEICADGRMSLEDSHAVAERVHDVIERSFPKVKHIMVHVNPAKK